MDNDNEQQVEPEIEDIEDLGIEKPIKKPKQKRNYVMTEARKLAVDRMKEGRKKKADTANLIKETDRLLLESAKANITKPKPKPKPKKQVIVLDDNSSSDEENQIIIRRKKAKPRPETTHHSVEIPQEIPVVIPRLKRL